MKTNMIRRDVLATTIEKQIKRIDSANDLALSRIDGDANTREVEILSEADGAINALRTLLVLLRCGGRTRDLSKYFNYQVKELITLRRANDGTY